MRVDLYHLLQGFVCIIVSFFGSLYYYLLTFVSFGSHTVVQSWNDIQNFNDKNFMIFIRF